MCFESLDMFIRRLVFKIYNIVIMQEWILGPTFGCVVPNFYFFTHCAKKKKGVAFVTCNYSPDSMLVLSLSIFEQYIHGNT